MNPRHFAIIILLVGLSAACRSGAPSETTVSPDSSTTAESPLLHEVTSPAKRKVLENAHEQMRVTRQYTQEYFKIPYPNGDVPADTGACTDVIIRGFRNAGIDLQKEVYEDMKSNFAVYPKKWGLAGTDTNIDHRRVPNLQTFFTRKGKSLPMSNDAVNYEPGDVVT